MKYRFEHVGFWGRLSDARVAETASKVIAHVQSRAARIIAPPSAEAIARGLDGIEICEEAELPAHADVILAIGGDGTMLHAARRVAGHGVPLLGINLGKLGFLTDVLPEQTFDTIDAILCGDYLAEERRMLEAELLGDGERPAPMSALNDVVLQKRGSSRILDFATWVDGSYVNTHGGDGLVVATPTGSTAYALSCGGPIIQPNLDAIVMVPICPHTLSDRPLVLPLSSVLDVRLHPGTDAGALVACDGEEYGPLEPEETLRISASQHSITMLHPKDYNYYELLRSKLNWGSASRFNRSAPRR
jgi:NAD+ kinase